MRKNSAQVYTRATLKTSNKGETVIRTLGPLALLVSFLSLSIASYSQQAEPPWLAALQQKQIYITRTSKDGTIIIKSGTKFTLKKGGMGTVVAEPFKQGVLAVNPYLIATNSYVNGAIVPEAASLLQHRAEQGTAMILPAGEKVWVAQIAPRKNEVYLILVTDLYRRQSSPGIIADQLHVDGMRFVGILKLPTPKGAEPDGDQIYASMLEVLAPEDSSQTAFCNALARLKSVVLSTIAEETVLPNGEPPDQNWQTPNGQFFHSETFILHGDQTQQIHTAVQSCLPGLTVTKPITPDQGAYESTLSGTDAPYQISFDIKSKLEPDGDTVVGVDFTRAQSTAQARLDDAAIAYVAVAIDTCGWALQTSAQAQNVNMLLGNRSKWLQDELDSANKHVADVGRLDFCSDPKEKAKFDRLVPTLWPVGTVGKP